MKVWYCHPYAGSEQLGMSLRPFYLSKNLLKIDVEAEIFGASYHHLFRTRPPQKKYTEDGVNFYFLGTCKYRGNGIGRILNMFFYALGFLSPYFIKHMWYKKPDVIIVSSAHPFHFIPLFFLAKLIKAKVVFEVRDLWPLSLKFLMSVNESNPFYRLVGWVEKFAYKKSNLTVSLLSNSKEYMVDKGLDENKFLFLPNGVDLIADSEPVNVDDLKYLKSISHLRKNFNTVFMYTGAHGVPNALDLFLEAAKECEIKKYSVCFVLIGEGGEKNKLVQFKEAHSLNNVMFCDSVPKKHIPCYLELTDVCFIGAQDSELYKYGISPNKIFDYMLAMKPVLSTIPSSTNPISESGGGWQLSGPSLNELVVQISKINSMPKCELDAIGKKGLAFVRQYHSYDNLAKKLKTALKDIIEK